MEEKKRMIQEALDYVDHRVTVYVGTGGTVFEECVELSRFALDRGRTESWSFHPITLTCRTVPS